MPPRGTDHPEEMKEQARFMLRRGASWNAIAQALGVDAKAVKNWTQGVVKGSDESSGPIPNRASDEECVRLLEEIADLESEKQRLEKSIERYEKAYGEVYNANEALRKQVRQLSKPFGRLRQRLKSRSTTSEQGS